MQDGQQPNEPGWVFKPGDQPTSEMSEETAQLSEQSEIESTAPQVSVGNEPQAQVNIAAGIENNETPQQAPVLQPSGEAHAEWTASEYIDNPKGAGWFMLLALASALIAVIVYFVTRDLISTIVTIILGFMLGIFAARQPRTLHYKIDNRGIQVGEKFYSYSDFKSFSIAHEHVMGYISLMPLKRFMPPLSIHYDPNDEDLIAKTLADYLPYEEHKPDIVDNLTRRLRF